VFFGGILYRVIFLELLRVFLLSLTGLTGLFVIAGVIQQSSQLGLGVGQILRIVPLTIPFSLPYTIPATVLFASCIVYGRIAHDNEAVVLKAAGVDLLALLSPVMTLGIIAMIVTAALSYQVIPQSQRDLQEELLRDPEGMFYNVLKRERMYRGSANVPWEVYVEEVRDRRLINVVAKKRAKNYTPSEPKYDQVVRTKEAQLTIANNKISIDSKAWRFAGKNLGGEIELKEPPQIDLPERYRKEFLVEELKTRAPANDWPNLAVLAAEWSDRAQENYLRSAMLQNDPEFEPYIPAPERIRQIEHHQNVGKYFDRISRTLMLEYHMRPALAFGCLCFAIIGCPVGLWANRADYLSTFVICFLPTIIVYYPILLSGGGMARDGSIPMLAGVWAANGVALVLAVILTWRLIKR
jgi:lipopolysaccharide export system permease protein